MLLFYSAVFMWLFNLPVITIVFLAWKTINMPIENNMNKTCKTVRSKCLHYCMMLLNLCKILLFLLYFCCLCSLLHMDMSQTQISVHKSISSSKITSDIHYSMEKLTTTRKCQNALHESK